MAGQPVADTDRGARLVRGTGLNRVAVRNLHERSQLGRGDEISQLEEHVVLPGQRRQRRPAVELVVIELPGQRSRAERMVDEDVDVVAVIVALNVERAPTDTIFLLAQVRPRVEEADFGIEQVVLHAAGITECAV